MDLVVSKTFAGVFLMAIIAVGEAADWSYDPTKPDGPQDWVNANPECAARRQSPIDFVHKEVTFTTFDDFDFQGYRGNNGTLVSIENLGHTAFIHVDGTFRMSGGGLPTEYEVLQAHFHWGTINQQGSEHAINGKLFPLELHIVHYAYKWFDSNDAVAVTSGNSEALAVLGILFEDRGLKRISGILKDKAHIAKAYLNGTYYIGEDDNEHFEEIITGVSNIQLEGNEHFFQRNVSLFNLLPEDKSRFYRYNGSLTTPPCYEVVAWTVFEDTVKISQDQMDHFRRLRDGNESQLIGNSYRPLQKWNDRAVYLKSKATVIKTGCLIAVMVAMSWFLIKEM